MVAVDQQLNSLNKGRKYSVFSAFVLFIKRLFISLFLPALFTTTLLAKEPVSVGVVNVTFIMENAPQAEVASTALKKKFSPQEKKLAESLEEINALAAELRKSTPSTESASIKRKKERELRSLKRARSRSLQDFREELRFARDVALDEVQKEVFSAIDDVRKQENIDIILQDFVSAAQRVDITPLVLGHLKKKLEIIKESKTDFPLKKEKQLKKQIESKNDN